jgi:hypothetical protein
VITVPGRPHLCRQARYGKLRFVRLLEITVGTGESGPVVRLSGEADLTTAGQLSDALKDRGGILELARPQPAVAAALSLLGVDQVLTVRGQVGAGAPGAGTDGA